MTCGRRLTFFRHDASLTWRGAVVVTSLSSPIFSASRRTSAVGAVGPPNSHVGSVLHLPLLLRRRHFCPTSPCCRPSSPFPAIHVSNQYLFSQRRFPSWGCGGSRLPLTRRRLMSQRYSPSNNPLNCLSSIPICHRCCPSITIIRPAIKISPIHHQQDHHHDTSYIYNLQ
jgi:hypothetical protein